MAAFNLTIKDETAGGVTIHEVPVSFDSELASVKEIIRARVYAEVDGYNNKMPEYFKGLVQPGDAEKTLNGYKMKKKHKIDAEQQYLVALDAFRENGYFLLIDNIQAESLEQFVVINEQTEISFIKLTPLVGG